MQPLRILILSDRRPGHFNLSEGIAAAIGRLRPVEIERLEVSRRRWPGHLLAALTRSRLPAGAMLRQVYGLDPAALAPADMIVSAGAETLAANIWLARALGCPNIFYGSLRLFSPDDFALVLTSYARRAERPRHALALKPSAVDPDLMRADPVARPPLRIALLVGGDAGTFHYGDEDWARLLALVQATAAGGVRWLVANSRRTPIAVSEQLASLAKARPDAIERWLDVRTAGPGTLKALLAAADAAVCTEDSSSMVSECVWARLPTVSVRPARSRLPPDEALYRDWLTQSGWCRAAALAGLNAVGLIAILADIRPLASNPQIDLADLIASRLPDVAGERSLKGTTRAKEKPAG